MKKYEVTFTFNIESPSPGLHFIAQVVMAMVTSFNLVLQRASAKVIAYRHSDGTYRSYGEFTKPVKGDVQEFKSVVPNSPNDRHRYYYIFLPEGVELVVGMSLTHEESLLRIIPHWEDLGRYPPEVLVWIRFEEEAEPSWHPVTEVLRQSSLPYEVTKQFNCIERERC